MTGKGPCGRPHPVRNKDERTLPQWLGLGCSRQFTSTPPLLRNNLEKCGPITVLGPECVAYYQFLGRELEGKSMSKSRSFSSQYCTRLCSLFLRYWKKKIAKKYRSFSPTEQNREPQPHHIFFSFFLPIGTRFSIIKDSFKWVLESSSPNTLEASSTTPNKHFISRTYGSQVTSP